MQFYRKPIKTISTDLLRLVGDVDDDGLRTGLWRAYRKDGSLYWEKGFDQGRLEGINRYYHLDKSIAIDSTFQDGFESDIQMVAPKGETDIPGFDLSIPGLVRLVNVSDGRYGYTNIEFYGADDMRITTDGAPFPMIPEGLPASAQFNSGNTETKGEPFWSDGVLERGTNEKLGLHRYWSALGEATLHVLYDDRGTERWRHSLLEPHPQTLGLEAFLAADPEVLNSTHLLWKIWTPDLHTKLMARLAEASDEVIDVYLCGINHYSWVKPYATQEGWVNVEQLTLEVIDAWRKRTKSPSGKSAEKILWRELGLRVRAFDKKRIKAIWKGLKDKEISYQNEHLASKTKALLAGELVQTKMKKRESIEERRHNSGNYGRHLRAYDRIDERGLYWSGKNVWWTFYRFGTSLMLQGTKYYPDRGQAEVIYDSFILCENYASTQRRLEGFKAMMPSGARLVDPFFDVKKGWAFAWSYASYTPRGEFCGGVHDNHWIDGNQGNAIETFDSAEEARARFERFEFNALKTGYYLQRLYALPVAEPKVTKKRRAKKAPEPVVNTGKIAKNVVPQLTRAAEAAEAGNVAHVIKHLGEAWRARPVAAIADMLDSCSKSSHNAHNRRAQPSSM